MMRMFMIVLCICSFLGVLVSGCFTSTKKETQSVAHRDINEVMKENTDRIMSLPGVVGIYIGVLEDVTPCIKVMVKEKTKELESSIPTVLEGHPVIIDVTGEIRPF